MTTRTTAELNHRSWGPQAQLNPNGYPLKSDAKKASLNQHGYPQTNAYPRTNYSASHGYGPGWADQDRLVTG